MNAVFVFLVILYSQQSFKLGLVYLFIDIKGWRNAWVITNLPFWKLVVSLHWINAIWMKLFLSLNFSHLNPAWQKPRIDTYLRGTVILHSGFSDPNHLKTDLFLLQGISPLVLGVSKKSRMDCAIPWVLYWPNPSVPHLGPDPRHPRGLNLTTIRLFKKDIGEKRDLLCCAFKDDGKISSAPKAVMGLWHSRHL